MSGISITFFIYLFDLSNCIAFLTKCFRSEVKFIFYFHFITVVVLLAFYKWFLIHLCNASYFSVLFARYFAEHVFF